MASVTFNFTATQSARIQDATIHYNTQNGTVLTSKQWVLQLIKDAVTSALLEDSAAAAINTARTTINNDLAGTA